MGYKSLSTSTAKNVANSILLPRLKTSSSAMSIFILLKWCERIKRDRNAVIAS